MTFNHGVRSSTLRWSTTQAPDETHPVLFCFFHRGDVWISLLFFPSRARSLWLFVLSIEGTFPLTFCSPTEGTIGLAFLFFPSRVRSPATKKGKNKRNRSENLSNPLTKKRGRAILTHEIANVSQFRPTKCENMVFLRDMDLTKSKAGAILY